MTRGPLRITTALAAAALWIGTSAPARAQGIPEVSTDGTLANPAAAPPSPEPTAPSAPEPVVIPIGPDGQVGQPRRLPGAEEEEGFYFNDNSGGGVVGLGAFGSDQPLYSGGGVPNSHVVRRGDTLWDITWFYFNNPFNWPRVWSFNPEISNPHWIYPGDQVRLYPEGQAPTVKVGAPDAGDPVSTGPAAARPRSTAGNFELRQLAFVDQENLKFAALVEGSTDEKLLLSLNDSIYLSYPSSNPPKVGKRYSIYRSRETVKHPKTGKRVGAYVRVIGELEVVSVKKGKHARAIITDSTDIIERGDRVGPLKRLFKSVKPAPNEVDRQGTIVAQLSADQLIGAQMVVIIDLGKDHGVKAGNRMFIVRRGDAYEDLGGRVSNTGQDDRRYPARAIGEVAVVQVGKTSSLCLVTLVLQEIGIGDAVLMRKAGDE